MLSHLLTDLTPGTLFERGEEKRGGGGGVACNPKLENKEKSDDDIDNVNNNYPEKFDKKGVFIRQGPSQTTLQW